MVKSVSCCCVCGRRLLKSGHIYAAELQLIRTIHDFTYNLNDRKQTDAILLHFCKAFDKVSHRHLKLKLEYYRVKSQTLKWIYSFLEEHTQCVVCGGYTSDPANVISGGPQGTVLGPRFI